jgi:hypothetical protein
MKVGEPRRDLVVDAVELAKGRLQAGEELVPLLITERWGDRGVEHFEPHALEGARARFGEFRRAATGSASCALAHLGHVGLGEQAIIIELGRAGHAEAEVFFQRFRPRRGRLRGFKLIGDLTRAGEGGSIP